MEKFICEWPTTPLYHAYHDYEWGDGLFMMINISLSIFALKICSAGSAGLRF